jgi:hypothetical protein
METGATILRALSDRIEAGGQIARAVTGTALSPNTRPATFALRPGPDESGDERNRPGDNQRVKLTVIVDLQQIAEAADSLETAVATVDLREHVRAQLLQRRQDAAESWGGRIRYIDCEEPEQDGTIIRQSLRFALTYDQSLDTGAAR